MRLSTKWTNGLKDKESIKKRVEASSDVLLRLKEILNTELDASIKEASKEENYTLPAWSEYQASKLGEQRALRQIIELLPKGN